MRITCPHCATVYDVPEARLGAGRRLRCARCQQAFAPDIPPAPLLTTLPPEQPPSPAISPGPAEPLVEPLIEPLVEPLVAPSRRRQADSAPQNPALTALTISVIVLCALLAAAYVWRAELMAAWPPSQRLFALLGAASS